VTKKQWLNPSSDFNAIWCRIFYEKIVKSKLDFREKGTVTAMLKGVNEFIPTLYIMVG
jgi:hypothetical protein